MTSQTFVVTCLCVSVLCQRPLRFFLDSKWPFFFVDTGFVVYIFPFDMAYKIRSKTFDYLVRAYLRGEEVTLETVPILTGIKTEQVVKVYWREFKKWLLSESNGNPTSVEETEQIEEEQTENENMSEETVNEVEVLEAPTPSPVAKKTLVSKKALFADLTGYTVKIEDDNGVEGSEEFEIVATSHSSKMIVVKEIKPILKDVIINGNKISLDLRKLNTMSPDDVISGVKVSTLLIAATIA